MTALVAELAAERAARGAALLDAKWPGWHARIDPAALDLADCTRCILAQLYRGFGRGVAALALYGRVADFGFSVDRDTWWDDLLAAWRGEIARRTQEARHGDPGGRADRSDVRAAGVARRGV